MRSMTDVTARISEKERCILTDFLFIVLALLFLVSNFALYALSIQLTRPL